MSRITSVAAGIALGLCLFFALADMASLSSGAKIFVYQGF